MNLRQRYRAARRELDARLEEARAARRAHRARPELATELRLERAERAAAEAEGAVDRLAQLLRP